MNQTQLDLASISMDLKRVAIGFHRNSYVMANRFLKEVLKRSKEMNSENLEPYLLKLLQNLKPTLSQKNKQKLAEDALMYSIIFQNGALKS